MRAHLRLLSATICFQPLLLCQEPLRDPAPPQVHELPAIEAPPAKTFDGLKTFATAKPLAADAQTEAWPSLRFWENA